MATSGKSAQIKFVFKKLDVNAKANSILASRTVPTTQQHSYQISKVPSGNISCTRTRSVSKKSARSGKKSVLPPRKQVQTDNFVNSSQPRSVASSMFVNSNRSSRTKKTCDVLNTILGQDVTRKKGKTPTCPGNPIAGQLVAQ